MLSCFSKILEKIVHSRTNVFFKPHLSVVADLVRILTKISTVYAVLDIISTRFDDEENKQFADIAKGSNQNI